MSLISIAVPVYHNSASLPALLKAFQELAARNPNDTFEFIFVDDGSTDNSFEVLLELGKSEPRLTALRLSRNFGSNAAIMAGLSQAKGDAVAAIAADLQDPPELLDEMLSVWRAGNKVVLAARRQREDPGLTSLTSDVFYALFRRFAIKTMPKRGFDFFLIDQSVCQLITSIEESNAYLMGLILWLGFNPQLVYYDRRVREKQYGRSMWTFTKRIKYFIDSFVAFSYIPVRFASGIGLVTSLLGMIYAAVIIIGRLFFGVQVEGWASLMVVLLVVSGAQLMMTGILGEYLWRNLDETRRRPRFIIDRKVTGNANPLPTSTSPNREAPGN